MKEDTLDELKAAYTAIVARRDWSVDEWSKANDDYREALLSGSVDEILKRKTHKDDCEAVGQLLADEMVRLQTKMAVRWAGVPWPPLAGLAA